MLPVGQRLVSAVAKPVVVDREQTWKAAKRKAFVKEVQYPLKYRLAVTARMAMVTSAKNHRTTCVLKRVLRLPLSGQTVENIRLKLVAPINMAMQRIASTTQLS